MGFIYGIVTAINIVLTIGFNDYVKERLKEEGYVYTDTKISLKERIINLIPFMITCLVPIIHVINLAGAILAIKKPEFKEKMYQGIKDNLIKADTIKLKDDYKEVETVNTKEEPKEEVVLHTNEEARNYWANYASVPILDVKKDEDESISYQKKIGSRK